MNKIYMYTEPKQDFPAFVAISDRPDGNFTLTVRSRWYGEERVGIIDLAPAQLEAMAFDILKALGYNL